MFGSLLAVSPLVYAALQLMRFWLAQATPAAAVVQTKSPAAVQRSPVRDLFTRYCAEGADAVGPEGEPLLIQLVTAACLRHVITSIK